MLKIEIIYLIKMIIELIKNTIINKKLYLYIKWLFIYIIC